MRFKTGNERNCCHFEKKSHDLSEKMVTFLLNNSYNYLMLIFTEKVSLLDVVYTSEKLPRKYKSSLYGIFVAIDHGT